MDSYLDGFTSIDRPAKIYIHQICVDTGCSLEDLPVMIDDRDGWRERERESQRIPYYLWNLMNDPEMTPLLIFVWPNKSFLVLLVHGPWQHALPFQSFTVLLRIMISDHLALSNYLNSDFAVMFSEAYRLWLFSSAFFPSVWLWYLDCKTSLTSAGQEVMQDYTKVSLLFSCGFRLHWILEAVAVFNSVGLAMC